MSATDTKACTSISAYLSATWLAKADPIADLSTKGEMIRERRNQSRREKDRLAASLPGQGIADEAVSSSRSDRMRVAVRFIARS